MIPFSQAWPYDIYQGELYVQDCPFCSKEHVLLPMKPRELASVREGKKKLLVFPCCGSSLTVIDSDSDYLLFDRAVR